MRLNQRGDTLINVLIAAVIMGILMMGTMTFFTDMFKSKALLDRKSEAYNMSTMIRTAIMNPQSCAKALKLAERPVELDKADLPKEATDILSVPLESLHIAGSDWTAGTRHGPLLIDSISLEIKQPQVPTQYVAKLVAVVSSKVSGNTPFLSTAGGGIFLRFAESKSDPSKLVLVECMNSTITDPRETCESLNGEWLESTLSNRYMPAPRCSLGTELALASNEAPDTVPIDGSLGAQGSMYEGRRVVECYYQPSRTQTVSAYRCPSPGALANGYRCVFEPSTRTWQVRYHFADGRTRPPNITCNRGVKVAILNDGLNFLNSMELVPHNEDVGSTDLPIKNVNEFLTQLSKASGVRRCRNMVSQDTWVDCTANTENDFIEARAGACAFVHQYRLSSSQLNMVKACASNMGSHPMARCPDPTDALYTGWLLVRKGRTEKPLPETKLKTSLGVSITEATGEPCYLLEYDRFQTDHRPAIAHLANGADVTAQTAPKYCLMSQKNAGIGQLRYHARVCNTDRRIIQVISKNGLQTATRLSAGGCFYLPFDSAKPIKISGWKQTKPTWVYLKADATLNSVNLSLDPANPNMVKPGPKTDNGSLNKMNLTAVECNEGVGLGTDADSGIAQEGDAEETQAFNYNELFAVSDSDISSDLAGKSELKDFVAQLSFFPSLKTCETEFGNPLSASNCANTDVSTGQGAAGACLFVRGMPNLSLSNTAYIAAKKNDCLTSGLCPSSLSGYTGWIKASGARSFSQSAPGVTKIGEPNGNICYRTTHSHDPAESSERMLRYTGSAPGSTPRQPLHCIVEDSSTRRYAAFKCGSNDLLDHISSLTDKDLQNGSCWYAESSVRIRNQSNSGSWILLRAQTDVASSRLDAASLEQLRLTAASSGANIANAVRCIGVTHEPEP